MKIYEASSRRDISTLVATREDWGKVLSFFDKKIDDMGRASQDRLRKKILSSLEGSQDIIRVTLSPDEARWILARREL